MEVWVWAPRARSSVDVVTGGRRVPLARRPRGRWSGDVPGLGPGTSYAFSLDGGPPRPDPRSRWQPGGVDGPSRVDDPAAFRWTDAGWRGFHLPSAVLYELHVGTFSAAGTFDGAIEHLDHVAALGVDAVEVMPVAEFPGQRGWGYDGVDLWAPHSAYGGPAGLRRLVRACHARGLGVVLDVVYNHLGPLGNHLGEFGPYFEAAPTGAAVAQRPGAEGAKSGETASFDLSAAPADEEATVPARQNLLRDRHTTCWGDAVNLDGPGSDEVRSFLVDNALMWLRDYHLDGLRLDAVQVLADTSAVHLLEQLSVAVRALAARVGRPLWLVAESDLNDPGYVHPPALGGYGLDAAWADDWHHALHAVLTGERAGYYADFGSLAQLAKALCQGWVYDGIWSPYRSRVVGRPPTGLDGSQFVVSTQNHDQVGNRAAGDRLGHVVSPARARVAAALLLTSPFVPLVFQGEEWGASTPFQYFTDHPDPALGRAVSEGRRQEFASFGWDSAAVPDPQDRATFERSRLRWDEVTCPAHAGLLDWYRRLIALRRSRPELATAPVGRARVTIDGDAGWLVVHRPVPRSRGGDGGDADGAADRTALADNSVPAVADRARTPGIAVAVNLSGAPRDVPVAGQVLMTSASEPVHRPAGGGLGLPPDTVAVVEVAGGGAML